ncbi:hypothetical protein GLW08_10595 [Pontibacillus yanchengensis]|uniref:Uncharacterized protein n=2 Tax=Pontibacillus yanchengensis TaxID=462910 RepID=A0ACC7VI32_9BACI|nr:hypothetical protein [Pontibacillus yanchengensis]MYL34316.1 hypothetical protein [Pontibacillus yanchengensis]MYL53785.1 hypothetical protein [Pontibacillus yanchengensis]
MKLKVLGIALGIALFTAGCSGDSEETEKQEQSNHETKENENTEMTGKVLEEDGVVDGSVYTEDGSAVGTIILEASVKKEKGKQLAEKYAKQLQNEYPDMKVNVQAVQDGENIANIVKEKSSE